MCVNHFGRTLEWRASEQANKTGGNPVSPPPQLVRIRRRSSFGQPGSGNCLDISSKQSSFVSTNVAWKCPDVIAFRCWNTVLNSGLLLGSHLASFPCHLHPSVPSMKKPETRTLNRNAPFKHLGKQDVSARGAAIRGADRRILLP